MPDDLRWSWCNNNRNKLHNKCNTLESSQSHPLPCPWKNCLPWNQSPEPKGWGPLLTDILKLALLLIQCKKKWKKNKPKENSKTEWGGERHPAEAPLNSLWLSVHSVSVMPDTDLRLCVVPQLPFVLSCCTRPGAHSGNLDFPLDPFLLLKHHIQVAARRVLRMHPHCVSHNQPHLPSTATPCTNTLWVMPVDGPPLFFGRAMQCVGS